MYTCDTYTPTYGSPQPVGPRYRSSPPKKNKKKGGKGEDEEEEQASKGLESEDGKIIKSKCCTAVRRKRIEAKAVAIHHRACTYLCRNARVDVSLYLNNVFRDKSARGFRENRRRARNRSDICRSIDELKKGRRERERELWLPILPHARIIIFSFR